MSQLQYLKPFPDLITSQVGEAILIALKTAGAQTLDQIYLAVSVSVKSLKYHAPTVMEHCNSAIAILLDNHLIEKWEYEGERDDSMIDYYDLPEDDDESA